MIRKSWETMDRMMCEKTWVPTSPHLNPNPIWPKHAAYPSPQNTDGYIYVKHVTCPVVKKRQIKIFYSPWFTGQSWCVPGSIRGSTTFIIRVLCDVYPPWYQESDWKLQSLKRNFVVLFDWRERREERRTGGRGKAEDGQEKRGDEREQAEQSLVVPELRVRKTRVIRMDRVMVMIMMLFFSPWWSWGGCWMF